MKWEIARRIVNVLYREKVYGMYGGVRPKMDKLELVRLMRWNMMLLAVENTVAISIVLPLISLPILLSPPEMLIQNIKTCTMIYNILLFITTFITVSTFTWSLQEFKFLEPLLQLPLKINDLKKILFLDFLYSAILILIIPLVYGVVVFEKMRLPQAIILIILYGYVNIFLASGISMAISSMVGRKRINRGFKLKIAAILRNLAFFTSMFFIGILYQLFLYMDFLLKLIGMTVPSLSFVTWLIYPFSVSQGVIMSRSIVGFSVALLICLGYLFTAKKTFDLSFTKFIETTIHLTYVKSSSVGKVSLPKMWVLWNPLNILIKDIKITFRDPRSVYIMMLPLFVVIEYLPMILIPTSPMEFKINLCILSISLFLVGCIIASLIPYQILEYESGKIWLLFSSAVSKKEIALGKSIFTAMSYLLYALPMGIIASILIQNVSPLIYALSGLLISFTVSLLSTFTAFPQISVDVKMIKLSLFKALMLLVLSSLLSLPLIFSLILFELERNLLIFLKTSYTVLFASIVELLMGLLLGKLIRC